MYDNLQCTQMLLDAHSIERESSRPNLGKDRHARPSVQARLIFDRVAHLINCLAWHAQVLLDVQSIEPDKILLLDSYFYVVVFHGTSIAQWRKEGYHLRPEHAQFKALLEVCLAGGCQCWLLYVTAGPPAKNCGAVLERDLISPCACLWPAVGL
jgi:hypothetical protein